MAAKKKSKVKNDSVTTLGEVISPLGEVFSPSTKPVEPKEVSVKILPNLAVIVEPSLSERYDDIELPEFLKGEGKFTKEAPIGFTPLIEFGLGKKQWRPGTWIIAKFNGVREGIGPNKSDMYDFGVTKDGKNLESASMWGCTIFDNKIRLLNPAPGDWLFIQYLGSIPTSRGMNEAKDFRLAIVDLKLIGQMGYAAAK